MGREAFFVRWGFALGIVVESPELPGRDSEDLERKARPCRLVCASLFG